jgi:GTP-binding protein HflX
MKVVLSDTVGFISELPTMLVAAFRATLEDVRSADLILHVRDVAHEDSEAQSEDVGEVLAALGIEAGEERPIFEVWNKADLLAPDERARLIAKAKSSDATPAPCLVVSAVTGEGVEQLLERMEAHFAQARATYSLSLNAADGKLMHWLHEIGEVLERRSGEDGRVFAVVRVAEKHREELERRIPNARAR